MERFGGIIEVLSLIVIVLSCLSMISYVNTRKGRKDFWFYNPLLIFDYDSMTRRDKGHIGRLFWLFIGAVVFLISVSFAGK